MFNPDAREGNAALEVKWDIVPYTRGRGLDLGCGVFKPFPHFIGIDNGDEWGFAKAGLDNGRIWTIDIFADVTDLSMFASKSMNFVFSSHLLEHLDNPGEVLKEWWRVVAVGGHMALYLPHKKYYPNMGHERSNPNHKHDFLPQDIIKLMGEIRGWDLVKNEDKTGGNACSFLQIYKKRNDKEQNHPWSRPKKQKRAAVLRYGGFGDMIQTASILPGLRDQGYHITMHTQPYGYEVMKHDPHIDEFVITDPGQVHMSELMKYFRHLKGQYDKFINLTESVEGVWLPVAGQTSHEWPVHVRRALYNDIDYVEFTHLLAKVPLPPKTKFYTTAEERSWAQRERRAMGGRVVMWVLSGSAVHKVWPYMDSIIATMMLEMPDVKVVFVGEELCQVIEQPWENEPRVIAKSGVWSIRETMAFAETCDLIIGPQTGVLAAMGMEEIPKIMTMSHSHPNNLVKHWKNTTVLEPVGCDCWPCHLLHFGFEHCSRDKDTGVAECQAKIGPDQMWGAISSVLQTEGIIKAA